MATTCVPGIDSDVMTFLKPKHTLERARPAWLPAARRGRPLAAAAKSRFLRVLLHPCENRDFGALVPVVGVQDCKIPMSAPPLRMLERAWPACRGAARRWRVLAVASKLRFLASGHSGGVRAEIAISGVSVRVLELRRVFPWCILTSRSRWDPQKINTVFSVHSLHLTEKPLGGRRFCEIVVCGM